LEDPGVNGVIIKIDVREIAGLGM